MSMSALDQAKAEGKEEGKEEAKTEIARGLIKIVGIQR